MSGNNLESNQLLQREHDLQQPQNDEANLEASKRMALAGQWRTPPLPVFPTSASSSQQSTMQLGPMVSSTPTVPLPPDPLQVTSLPIPVNSEDYAKALQEAYRRGAEAAAALVQQQQQQQQQQHVVPSASCPNFVNISTITGVTVAAPTTPSAMEAPVITSSAPAPIASMPATAPPIAPFSITQSACQPPLSANVKVAPPSSASMMPPLHPPTSSTGISSAGGPSRSMSLPDMASYAAREKAEEEKRQKRLARNRASARLRRLRKKNLVDAYETEVGILEKSLANLRAHSWGNSETDDHKALLEALSMERGQQAVPREQRASLIQDILQQQLDQVAFLQESQMEQQVLSWLAANQLQLQQEEDEEARVMAQELQELLQLTPEQCEQLHSAASVGLEEEVQALDTVKSSLQAMKDNDWLVNEGVTQITDQFTSILHTNQLSKFLLWTDANAEAIEQLDYVHVVTPTPNSPIFSFGVDDYHASGSMATSSSVSATAGGSHLTSED